MIIVGKEEIYKVEWADYAYIYEIPVISARRPRFWGLWMDWEVMWKGDARHSIRAGSLTNPVDVALKFHEAVEEYEKYYRPVDTDDIGDIFK